MLVYYYNMYAAIRAIYDMKIVLALAPFYASHFSCTKCIETVVVMHTVYCLSSVINATIKLLQ